MKLKTLFIAVTFALSGHVYAGSMDAVLAGLAASPQAKPGQAQAPTPNDRTHIKATLRYSGEGLKKAEAQGAIIRRVMGDVATVEIPLSQLENVSRQPGVERIEAVRTLQPMLSASVLATRADKLRGGEAPHWTGKTGRNVIIGIIDSGLDTTHPSFRKLDGSSRVLAYWTRGDGSNDGVKCTQEQISNALLHDAQGECAGLRDPHGHGTHVAGIAAGNGSAANTGFTAYEYVGMAPEADLMVSELREAKPPNAGQLDEMNVLESIAWMKDYAKAANKPLVVNMSFGTHAGPLDGTSNFERALNNLAGPGVILVAAAGNEGNAPMRAAVTLAPGQTEVVQFSRWYTNDENGDAKLRMEAWYPGANRLGVSIRNMRSKEPCDTGEVLAGPEPVVKAFSTACGRIEIVSNNVNPTNGDRQLLVTLSETPEEVNTVGWEMVLRNEEGHAASFGILSHDQYEGSFRDHTSFLTTLITPASAERTIAVGSYTTRESWKPVKGEVERSNSEVGNISASSSRGPRRECSDKALCPMIMKPEIVAPGQIIISSRSATPQEVIDAGEEEDSKTADGMHIGSSGTSMAAPHVAGAVALLLQTNPTLTPEQVKQALFSSAGHNSFTGKLPLYQRGVLDPANANPIWGYGILDAFKAAETLDGKESH
ncbi:S8 family serine peptidase [Pseudomonas batumici]|uniref:S8 family serine peptidase n=1 Tax=Pseudomonas batumici TaxID=226910 RepID=UPI0030CD17D8